MYLPHAIYNSKPLEPQVTSFNMNHHRHQTNISVLINSPIIGILLYKFMIAMHAQVSLKFAELSLQHKSQAHNHNIVTRCKMKVLCYK